MTDLVTQAEYARRTGKTYKALERMRERGVVVEGTRTHAPGMHSIPHHPATVPATYDGGDCHPAAAPCRFPEKFPGDQTMLIAESIRICERTLAAIDGLKPPNDPPVIMAPPWWTRMVRLHGGGREDDVVDSFCGCKVIMKEEAKEPMLVAADGRAWSILPTWARNRDGAAPAEEADHGLDH